MEKSSKNIPQGLQAHLKISLVCSFLEHFHSGEVSVVCEKHNKFHNLSNNVFTETPKSLRCFTDIGAFQEPINKAVNPLGSPRTISRLVNLC